MTCKNICAALLSLVAALPMAAQAGDYTLLNKFALGGEGGWDYLSYDKGSKRLFIARGNRVQVVDAERGVVTGEISDTPGVHGVALATDLGKGYSSNGRDNSVTVFDMVTLKPLARISTPAGENPDFIAYDPASKQVLAFNGRSHNVSIIDANRDQLVATLPLAGKPEAAVADGQGLMFVDIEDKNEITVIDTRKNEVLHHWPLSGCDEPAGLALNAQARRLFVGCHNKTLLVVNADTGKTVASLPIGAGVDANAFDAQTGLVFSSQGDGTLSIIKQTSTDKFFVQQTASTQRGARTLALNPDNHHVYLVSAEFDEAPATAAEPRPRRLMRPGSFVLLVMGEK